jgi:DNA repair protein RecN (Recombination protein N)
VLLELLVENYAVAERVRVHFHSGLNVLTGETGSGKSIVVDALGLLFGGRASADMVRSGATRAHIAGIFECPKASLSILEEAGFEPEDNELIVEREILSSGKSRAFVASRPATAALLRDLAGVLGDIHGQHDQQRLFAPEAQLDLLDSFAKNDALLSEIAEIYREWRACANDLDEIQRNEQEKLRLLDLWSFQRSEIEAAQLTPGEETELEAERRILQNVGRLLDSSNVAYNALYDAPDAVQVQLRLAIRKVEELCRIDESLNGVLETLQPAHIAVEESADALRSYMGKLEADPNRLEEIESRLASIDKLKRKYGADTVAILDFLKEVQEQISSVESTAERRAAIEAKRAKLAAAYTATAQQLSSRRKEAAKALKERIEQELKSLAMSGTVFEAQVSSAPWSSKGSDTATFLVSANVGEEPRRLEKVASGGELSRLALALKTCVTAGSGGRTLVFDEVDAGIGGTAAESVGKRLKDLATNNQVLCVTHLAQIAGFADHHYAVEKNEVRGRTIASIEELSGEARTREIGRMLSGHHLTPEALRHAEQLIKAGERE